jgi:putative ABC transport system permease protein
VLPTALAARHITNPMLSSVLVRTAPRASAEAVASRLERLAVRYPDITVGDRHEHAARVDANRESNNWLFRILSGIIFVFTAIAVVNTLTMIALHRTRELALLRLVGGTRRQILAMARWEGGMVVGLGVGLGAAIALTTLIPTSNAISGSPIPYAPAGLIALVLGASAAVGLLATQFATRLALRPRPVDGIGLRD